MWKFSTGAAGEHKNVDSKANKLQSKTTAYTWTLVSQMPTGAIIIFTDNN
jgi:hypothetical protein